MKDRFMHYGWIRWITGYDPNKDLRFRLSKNPCGDFFWGNQIYVVPRDVAAQLGENPGLIRLDINAYKPKYSPKSKRSLYYKKEDYFIVSGFEKIDFDIFPTPNLLLKSNYFDIDYPEALIDRLSMYWKNSDNNRLFLKQIAYNIISCPMHSYGKGGIGVESFSRKSGKKPFQDLKRILTGMMPYDYTMSNDYFEFDIINNNSDSTRVQRRRTDPRSREICFNDMSDLKKRIDSSVMPIQFPLIYPEDVKVNSQIKSYGLLDPDIYDYQLRSFLFTPSLSEKEYEKFQDISLKYSNKIRKKYTVDTLEVDKSSIIKLANAYSRIYNKTHVKNNDIYNIKNELEEMFKEYHDEYVKTELLGGRKVKIRLSHDGATLLDRILEMDSENSEIGIRRITIDRLKAVSNLNDYSFDFALAEIVDKGYVRSWFNSTELSLYPSEHYENKDY